jgi:hypothetical protein
VLLKFLFGVEVGNFSFLIETLVFADNIAIMKQLEPLKSKLENLPKQWRRILFIYVDVLSRDQLPV